MHNGDDEFVTHLLLSCGCSANGKPTSFPGAGFWVSAIYAPLPLVWLAIYTAGSIDLVMLDASRRERRKPYSVSPAKGKTALHVVSDDAGNPSFHRPTISRENIFNAEPRGPPADDL